jgi:hypothetical protein
MSQLIACKNRHGIVLASDSKGFDLDVSGNMIEVKTERLVQLSEQAAILFGGAIEGLKMCKALRGFVGDEGLQDVQEIYSAALPFLGSEYERFMREKCKLLPVDPLHHLHFILAGSSTTELQDTYHLYLLWTKKKLPQLDGDEIGLVYTVPRRMGLEYELNGLCKEDASQEQLLQKIRKRMDTLEQQQEEVGSPFAYALITRKGFRRLEQTRNRP